MKYLVLLFSSFVLCISCTNRAKQNQKIESILKINDISDTTIGTKNITNEIAGSAYLKKAICYFVIVKQDTSGFMPIFTESKENGETGIRLNLSYSNKTDTYIQRMNELKLILQQAGNEFNFDSLSSMSIGRLILTGDLAVDLSMAYKNKFGENEKITTADYGKISDFLLESKMAKDLNELFEPYSKSVEKILIEKAFFITRDELLKLSNVSGDTLIIPKQILDCITWIRFKNK